MSDPAEQEQSATGPAPLFGWARPGRDLAIGTVVVLFAGMFVAVFVRWLVG